MADTSQSETLRHYTPEELAEFDGKDGRAAYVAYKGKVYDVTDSRLWRKGVHVRAHNAGNELTLEMSAAPHDDDVMDRMTVVGLLIDEAEDEAEGSIPLPVQLSLDHHLHPIAVHFPTAMGAVSPVFALASLLFAGNSGLYAGLQYAAFWCLVVCFLSSIPSIITGWVSWYYNYAAVMTPIYRVKWGGSVVLLVLCAAALLLKFLLAGGLAVAEPGQAGTWIYTGLLVLIAANVAVLGHYGGKITFPS